MFATFTAILKVILMCYITMCGSDGASFTYFTKVTICDTQSRLVQKCMAKKEGVYRTPTDCAYECLQDAACVGVSSGEGAVCFHHYTCAVNFTCGIGVDMILYKRGVTTAPAGPDITSVPTSRTTVVATAAQPETTMLTTTTETTPATTTAETTSPTRTATRTATSTATTLPPTTTSPPTTTTATASQPTTTTPSSTTTPPSTTTTHPPTTTTPPSTTTTLPPTSTTPPSTTITPSPTTTTPPPTTTTHPSTTTTPPSTTTTPSPTTTTLPPTSTTHPSTTTTHPSTTTTPPSTTTTPPSTTTTHPSTTTTHPSTTTTHPPTTTTHPSTTTTTPSTTTTHPSTTTTHPSTTTTPPSTTTTHPPTTTTTPSTTTTHPSTTTTHPSTTTTHPSTTTTHPSTTTTHPSTTTTHPSTTTTPPSTTTTHPSTTTTHPSTTTTPPSTTTTHPPTTTDRTVKTCINNGTWNATYWRCICIDGWVGTTCQTRAKGCKDIADNGYTRGWPPHWIYIEVEGFSSPLYVRCQLQDTYFTLYIMINQGRSEGHNKSWNDYEKGYMLVDTYHYWMGLKAMKKLNDLGHTTVFMETTFIYPNSTTYFQYRYDNFRLETAANGYSFDFSQSVPSKNGEYSDKLQHTSCLDSLKNVKFSTRDHDNDGDSSKNCAALSGVGWWYKGCTMVCNPLGLSHEYFKLLPDKTQYLTMAGLDYINGTYAQKIAATMYFLVNLT